ncbi:MAG: hypothetical protein AB7V56_15255 [Candidatus Nitrosocosmicus sp.]
MGITKSKSFFILVSLIIGVFLTPLILSYDIVQGTVISAGDDSIDSSNTDSNNSGDNANSDTSSSDTSNSIMKSAAKGSHSHVQAKNTQQSIYNCATGQKGVIINPGSFKMSADKKNGKWHGIISIKGSTGEKSGHIISGKNSGVTYSFKGNLDTKNTLCHFPGLQLSGTSFDLGSLTCGTLKNIKYTELSSGNANYFKVLITCS